MYAQLGDIQFEGLKGFEVFDRQRESVLPQHDRIDGKPRLQRTGDKLDEIKLVVRLHSLFCDPEFEIRRLNTHRSDGEILPFSSGSGVYWGDFVIQKISEKVNFTTPTGELVHVDLEIKLVEFYDPDKEKTAAEAAIRDGFGMRNNNPTPANVNPTETDMLEISNGASATLSAGNDADQDFKNSKSGGFIDIEKLKNWRRNVQRTLVKAQNTVARIQQSAADVQSAVATLESDLDSLAAASSSLIAAIDSGDPSAMDSLGNLFAASNGAISNTSQTATVPAALRLA